MSKRHEVLGGKVQIYQRPGTPHWQCSASIDGRQFRATTKQESLSLAKEVAQDWFLTLKGKARFGGGIPQIKPKGQLFRDAAAKFMDEFELLAGGQRSPVYIKGMQNKIKNHLNPFFGDMTCNEITDTTIQDYRVKRAKAVDKNGKPKPPARPTMHHEMITLRHILKTAKRNGWIQHLPDLSAPYKSSGKIRHRAWFSPEEYKQFYMATRARAKSPAHPKWKWESEQFHDFVLFMANTGLRPDEAARLQFRDVVVVDDDATNERILEIEVRGKRGVGFCKSMPGAVGPFNRLCNRPRAHSTELTKATRDRRAAGDGRRAYRTEPKRERGHSGVSRGHGPETAKPGPKDLIFGSTQRELMNTVLDELGLKFDRDEQARTAYSLLHTYICFRLMEGADIYQVAKNCRTSVEIIEKYYASHIKNVIDASAINVRRVKTTVPKNLGALTAEED